MCIPSSFMTQDAGKRMCESLFQNNKLLTATHKLFSSGMIGLIWWIIFLYEIQCDSSLVLVADSLMASSPPYYNVLISLCARLSMVQVMTGKILHWNLPEVMFWEKIYLICPEEKITAAKRRVCDLDANLHSLRRIHLHILHNQLTFWLPRHGSFTMYKNELWMYKTLNP